MAAASSCIAGITLEYLSRVNATELWPSRSCITFGWTPACNPSVAWVCLSPCTVRRGRPDALTSRSKRSDTRSAWRPAPSSRVNTRPVAVHADPHARRSSSWRLRHSRSTLAVPASSATDRRPWSVFGVDSHISWLTATSVWRGLALVVAAGFTPTAVLLHPNDWVESVSPFITAGGSLSELLDVPVVKSASVPEGTGYVGAWSQLAVWLRSTDVFVSQSHSDYLTRNLVAILAELRAAVGVLAPAALCRVTGI